MKLHFVSSPLGRTYTHEILEIVASAAATAGADVSVHIGTFPEHESDSVYVVVPHEFFALTAEADRPAPEQMARTIAFCVEHPGNETFEVSARWAAQLGAVIDINRDSCEELTRRGLRPVRYTLGYTPEWDAWRGDVAAERTVDITYMGTTDVRRDNLLAAQAVPLSRWRTKLLIPPHEEITAPRPDFLIGRPKYEHLARCKVLINLHRGASRALEWVRVLEAMFNGCVVVSEHSVDFEPFTPGVHLAFARPETCADVASALLRHPERLDSMRDAAYAFCKTELSMQASVERLLEVAESLGRSDGADARPQAAQGPPRVVPVQLEVRNRPTGMPVGAPWSEALPEQARETIARIIAHGFDTAEITIDERSLGPREAAQCDVLLAGSSAPAAAGATIRSLEGQEVPLHLLTAGCVLDSPEMGLPRGRLLNALSERMRTGLALVIDPGHLLFPGALRALIDELTRDPDAGAAYGMMADTLSGLLWNSLPPEVSRLRSRVYLGAPLLLRREALEAAGGFSEDPAVSGFEDHDLWLRLLGSRVKGRLIPSILGRGSRHEAPSYGISALLPASTAAALSRAGVPVS